MNEEDILEYDLYDADWEDNISIYYDFNLLDLLDEMSDFATTEDSFENNKYNEITIAE